MECGPFRKPSILSDVIYSLYVHLLSIFEAVILPNIFLLLFLLPKEKGLRENSETLDFTGVPNGSRTRVVGVKGRCPRPLDDGDIL